MVQRPVELVHGVRPEGVADLGSVEGDPDAAGVDRTVVGDVGELQAGHLLPGAGVEDCGHQLSGVGAVGGGGLRHDT